MMFPKVPKINPDIKIDIKSLLSNEVPLVFDNFFTDLDWLGCDSIFNNVQVNEYEQILHLHKDFRIPLLNEVSKLLPDGYYPTDTGWIRSIKACDDGMPAASKIHADAPYIVVSVCLSSPKKNENNNSFGTMFLRHKDFEFKKITNCKKGKQFQKLFLSQQGDESSWESWFTYSFKKNRAIVYDGSLFHKMPWPLSQSAFGNTLQSSRLMQTFSFRLRREVYGE